MLLTFHFTNPPNEGSRTSDIFSLVIYMLMKVKAEAKVEEGDPGDVICEMVKVLKADLLVMGSHGYGQLTRYFDQQFNCF